MPNLREPNICPQCWSSRSDLVSNHDCTPTTIPDAPSGTVKFCDCPCRHSRHTDLDSGWDEAHDNGSLSMTNREILDLRF